MRINLTTQTSILTISNDDLSGNGYLYKYFDEEINKTGQTNIKTLVYNEEINALVLLTFDKENGFNQKIITLEDYENTPVVND